MLRSILLLCLVIISGLSYSQTRPAKVGPGIISDDGAFGFTLSPDGTTAFWVRSAGKRDTLIIMESTLINGKWREPQPATFSGNPAWKDIDPVFSPDGNTILFQSTRPVEGKPDRKGFDIWMVNRSKSGWREPRHLGNEINSDASESYASITNEGHIYFMKDNPDGKGSSDIYCSRFLNGKYTAPENIGSPVNTAFRESNPFISPDETYIIYFSSDSTGYGEVDLFISFRDKNGWSTPRNMGVTVNSKEAEFCPFYHVRQKRLYFARQHREKDRFVENIYSIDADPQSFR